MPRPIRSIRLPVVAALLCVTALVRAQDRPLPDADRFLAETREGLLGVLTAQGGYAFTVTRREATVDEDGRVTDESVKVYDSFPGLPGEERWERLVAEDGVPVPADALEQQDRERQEAVAALSERLARDPDGVHERQRREWDEYVRGMRKAIADIFRVYDIRMRGREQVAGHDAIAFTLTPRPDADPETSEGDRMKHFALRAWINEADHELVKLEGEAVDTTSIWWGLVARIHEGTTFSYERRQVNGETWLPFSTRYDGSARVGLIKVVRRRGSSEYSNYRKFSPAVVAAAGP